MTGMSSRPAPLRRGVPDHGDSAAGQPRLEKLVGKVARGDIAAFEQLYDRVAGQVFGVVKRVLRDPAQSEEVAQEVFMEVWQTATRFDEDRGSASTWIFTVAHHRAVDRVRSSQAATDREDRVAHRGHQAAYDVVAEEVQQRLDVEAVRRCLDTLTELQIESVRLAYFNGYTYAEVATLLDKPLPTIKTRMRDGLIRLRDCLEARTGP